MRHDPCGSVWRRWDLHFHTPASTDYGFRAASAKDLVEELIKAGVKVVAVTDHHVIDVERVRQMQEIAGKALTIFPGIECRSELGGKESVHFTGIFPEDCDLEDVWVKLRGVGITERDVADKGDDAMYVRFVDGCNKIRELGGVVAVHAGRKSNSIEILPANTCICSRSETSETGKATRQRSSHTSARNYL